MKDLFGALSWAAFIPLAITVVNMVRPFGISRIDEFDDGRAGAVYWIAAWPLAIQPAWVGLVVAIAVFGVVGLGYCIAGAAAAGAGNEKAEPGVDTP